MTGSPKGAPRLVLAVALLMLDGGVGQASLAGDLRGARVESQRSDLRGLRGRIDDAPRASVYDLKQLERRLAEQRVDRPDDPRQGRLELELRHERWRAERILRQDDLAQVRARLAASRDQLAPPGYRRAPTDLDIRGSALPIGTGKLFLFVQTGLRDVRAALDRGRTRAAAGQLAAAEAGLRALRSAWAGDPNLLALEAELAELAGRVTAGQGEG
jgi:hypothetical protein